MYRKKAFTLVELIVVITILSILGTLGFISLQGYSHIARDSVRISDIKNIQKVVELYKLENGTFPVVSNPVPVTYSGTVLWTQGSFGQASLSDVRRLSQIPLDPLTNSEYAYSVTQSTGEYEIGVIIENSKSVAQNFIPHSYTQGKNLSYIGTRIVGNYNGKFLTYVDGNTPDPTIYVLGVPTILSRLENSTDYTEIFTKNAYVFGNANAPISYSGTVDIGEWNFRPNSAVGIEPLIYTGSVSRLSTDEEKIKLVSYIQQYYGATDIVDSQKYSDIKDIDSTQAVKYVDTLIQGKVGGLSEDIVNISPSLGTSLGNENTNQYTPSFCSLDISFTNSNGGLYIPGIIASSNVFAALKDDGSIFAWGNASNGGTGEPTNSGYTDIFSTAYAFAALKDDGSISAWGDTGRGGIAPSGSGYTQIFSSNSAFAALKGDGSITVWGIYSSVTGVPTGTGYTKIFSNNSAFAALKDDGSISAWGASTAGGTGAPSGTGYTDITATHYAFAALKGDGSIAAWGDTNYGGTSAPTGTGYTKIFSNYKSFAALKGDGSIAAWGDTNYGGTGAPTGTGYTKIFSNNSAFAALKGDGSIAAWGNSNYGGTGVPTGTGYTKIFSTDSALAALKDDGSIAAWGSSVYGGSGAPTGTGYINIFSNDYTFAALKDDGSIKTWGSAAYGVNGTPTGTGYTNIFSTSFAFAALKGDGSITAWGSSTNGGTGAPTDTGYVGINGGKEKACNYY